MQSREAESLLNKAKLPAFVLPPSLVSPPSSPPGSHPHHHAGVQKLLRWVCPSPSASHAAHAEGEEEGEWIESSAPLLTPPPNHHSTHSPTHLEKNNRMFHVHTSLPADIRTDVKHEVSLSLNRVLVQVTCLLCCM